MLLEIAVWGIVAVLWLILLGPVEETPVWGIWGDQ